MSFRPTVTVYYNGELMTCEYCRDFSLRGLIMLAIFFAAYLEDCESADEIQGRLFGPKEYWPDKDQLEAFKDIEGWSELPLLVDLTARSIYIGVEPASPERLARMKDVNLSRARRLFSEKFRVLNPDTQIPFSIMDLGAMRESDVYKDYLEGLKEWIVGNQKEKSAAST